MNNFKKYLPSQKFITIVLFIITLIIVFSSIKNIVKYIRNNNENNSNLGIINVSSLIQKDSNNNGIADWEEYLWGLNPSINGIKNKEFIINKKKELEQKGLISNPEDEKVITNDELLSRQFFATIISLQGTGQLNDESIKSLSDSIGQQIKAVDIPDVFNKEMLIIKKDSDENDSSYIISFSALVDKYKNRNIGSELTIIAQGIVDNDPQALYTAKTIADAYREFSKELIKIPVPSSAALIHLKIANDYEKIAQSIEGLVENPLIGMSALLTYKKYTDDFEIDLDKMSDILQ